MFGYVGPDRYDVPIFGGMDAAVAHQPVGKYDARILSIDISGDAAAVKVAHIVAKSFDHVGATA